MFVSTAEATDIRITDVSNTELFVSWALPQVDAVCPHEPIVCHVREGGVARVCQSFQTESLTSFSLTELEPCTSYSVQVIILTPGNLFEATAVQHQTLPDVPGSVTQLEVWDLTSRTMTLRWSPPLNTSLECITGYQVCWSAEDDGYAEQCSSFPADSTQVTLTELAVCANYTIEVTTFGTGGNSSTTAITTYSGVGPILSASSWTANITTLYVAWGYDTYTNRPCASHFEVLVCEEASPVNQSACDNHTIALQPIPDVYLTDLSTCQHYYMLLYVIDLQDRRSDVYVVPGYVDGLAEATDIRITDVSSTELFVSWSLPRVGAVCPHEPIVCHERDGGEGRACQSFQTESLASFSLTELEPCDSYSVQVNILTPGNLFEATAVQHLTLQYNNTMVIWVEAREVSRTQLTVAWRSLYTSPPCVQEYRVCWAPAGSDASCATAERSTTSHQVTGLQERTTYNLEVTALFRNGSRSDAVTTSTTTSSSNFLPGSRTNVVLLLSLLLVFKHRL